MEYDKHDGELIGLTNLENINSHPNVFGQALFSSPTSSSKDCHGVHSTRLLQFAVSLQSAERGQALQPLLGAACQLENCGLKVHTLIHISAPTVFAYVYIPLARH